MMEDLFDLINTEDGLSATITAEKTGMRKGKFRLVLRDVDADAIVHVVYSESSDRLMKSAREFVNGEL
ncbi:uncharacterized protein METZ01_LOCUS178314 [marine metagenome]|uniref:Uncharacterized protein n=1 Tax=marine metagenome TaxID=408172 RepID=A0A382CHE3_9ZZZZ